MFLHRKCEHYNTIAQLQKQSIAQQHTINDLTSKNEAYDLKHANHDRMFIEIIDSLNGVKDIAQKFYDLFTTGRVLRNIILSLAGVIAGIAVIITAISTVIVYFNGVAV